MKSRAAKSAKAAPKKDSEPKAVDWEKIRKYPVVLFHSAGGPPIMGRLEKQTPKGVQLWAPAHITMPSPTNVVYLPVAFVDKYIQLTWAAIRGTNPIDPVIVAGYEGYFNQFIKDSYRMKPLMVSAAVDPDAGAHSTELPPQEVFEKAEEDVPEVTPESAN